MMKLIDLTDKRIVVVGASSGIGRQTAITLSRLGAKIVLIARRKEQLEETLAELEGDGHSYYSADFSNLGSIEPVFKNVTNEQGCLDGLVYAAGITDNLPIKLFKPEKMEELFKINFFGFAESVRQASKKGRFNDGMRIVGVSSISSLIGSLAHMGYAASKGAMNAAARCMAKELAPKGICINTVAPGMVATKMYEDYLIQNGEDSEINKQLLERQYLGIGRPEDVANAIAFLISPAARLITGTTLVIDGGRTSS